jgi:hypothetical protein
MSPRILVRSVVLLLCASPGVAQTIRPAPRLRIVELAPPANALGVPRDGVVEVVFNQPVDPASLDARAFRVVGRWSGVRAGTTQLLAGGRLLRFTPAQPFSAGELVQVLLARSLRSRAGTSLGQGFAWSFWTASRTSSGAYTQIGTLFPGDTPYGGHGGDIDGDGDLDLCIPNENTSDVSVYLNQGTGTFGPEATYGVGFHCSASEAGDYDGDGDADLVVANILDDDVSLLRGNGDGTFQAQQRHPSGQEPRGITALDADGDGDLDVVTANRVTSDLSLLVNTGGSFAPELRFDGGLNRETGVVAADMDGDGITDLVVIGYTSSNACVLRGDGLGAFTPLAPRATAANPWMVAVGDLNGDGANDVATAGSGANQASVLFGDGSGGLLAATHYATGSFPIAIDIGDLNGDGLLDLTASCFGADFDLYHNLGGGLLGNHTVLPAFTAGSCTVLHDRDGDGDVDITGIDELADRVLLFRQDG